VKDKKLAILYGINPILEALKSGRRQCHKVIIEQGKTSPRIASLQERVLASNIKLESLPKKNFQQKYSEFQHQGVVGYFSPIEPVELDVLIDQSLTESQRPTLVLLDEIQDPQNLGAIIRSAEIFGVQGLILPRNRSASLNETVAKCSAGAIENLPICWTTNLNQACSSLKEKGFWIVAVDPQGETSCSEFRFEMPTALIIGGEGKGIRPLLKKSCDFSIRIPMAGKVESLNASAACAVVFYEVLRQKQEKR
jgi:23S rRNA (guanosine2251-2'-O)-methyltransferase